MQKPTISGWGRAGLSFAAALVAAAFVAVGIAWAAQDGTVVSLTASDAPSPGQTITISATLLANSAINNSNVYYEILAPDGTTVVATHTTDPPNMAAGETFSDSWTTTNTSFTAPGTYSLRLCWSPGGSSGCQIIGGSPSVVSFYSVPTLSAWLWPMGLALLGWFLWARRADFQPQVVRVRE